MSKIKTNNKMKKSIIFITLFFLSFLFFQGQQLFATNIQVNNIVIVERNDAEQYIIVQFDLSWDNSFRVDDGANTNWDAAWVFMKFKKSTATNVQWGHATLSGSGHTIPGNFNGDIGTTGGVNKGMFVYPSVIFNGTASIDGIRLKWDYGEDGLLPEDEVDINVFGTEMVYVPQGDFYAGSGGSETSHFHAGGQPTDVPFQVSDGAFQIENNSGHLYATGNINSTGALNTDFPTGYNGYYVMKHSITQQAYVDFLNTLDYAGQDARTNTQPNSTGYLYNSNRHKIKVETAGSSGSDPAVYATDNKWVACGYLSKKDILSYLDWAALRPMTELEYEKAARGPSNPVPNEYAWGNTRIGKVSELQDAGTATETPDTENSGFQRDITIDHNKIDEDLTDFPILVKLDSNNFDFSKARPDGYDIRFYDVLGNELKYQRERHDESNEKAEYWVKVPEISSSENTVITMEYGNSSASDGEDAANVWNDGNFTSLWHFTEDGDGTAGEYADAFGSNNGQGTGTIPTRIDSLLGFGQDFPSDAAISVPDDASLGIENKITLSGWVNPREITGARLADSTSSDWNDNHSISNITVDGDSLAVTDHTSAGTRVAKPISLDSIKNAGSSNISWESELGYKVVAYKSDGTFTVPEGVSEVDVLVVAGGGGGGGNGGGGTGAGGGGAGGLVWKEGHSVTPGSTVDVAVGSGGTGGAIDTRGNPGENSHFGSVEAIGGGAGDTRGTESTDWVSGNYGDGGSGGGSNYADEDASVYGAGTSGQGNDGGTGEQTSSGQGGGGGGAGAQGEDGLADQTSTQPHGGDGLYYGDIFGDTYGENGYFAGGGGGGSADDGNVAGPGDGGQGGGGNGGGSSNAPTAGSVNTGGGGGGAGGATGSGADGGSGIVLVRYKSPESVNVYTVVNNDNTSQPQFKGQEVFNSDGTFTVPDGITEVDVLVVGGGGAGSGSTSGGGGAGGLVWKTDHSVTPGDNISVSVGAGGTGGGPQSAGTNGENSSFGSIVATGGGHGSVGNDTDADAQPAGSGGSGGGAMEYDGHYETYGTGTSGQGYNGGDVSGGSNATAGGGGAGGVGSSVASGAGNGGIGKDFSHIFGTSVGENGWFAGGGGGGFNSSPGQGGLGGGGDGINNDSTPDASNHGTPNTGGGGGGGWNYNTGSGGDGGSGVVIVRWGNDVGNGDEIPGISEGDDLSGKYLWVMQELKTNNPDYSPSFKSLDVKVKGEAVIAGKGEDAYQLSVYDGNLKGYLNNQEVSSSLTNNEFQHVALTFDGSYHRIYINGLLTGTSSLTGSINNNSKNFLMGSNLEGLLDEFRVHDTSRSQAWLKAEYHTGNLDVLTIGGEGALSNAVVGNVTYPSVGESGPLRVGFGATSTSSRTAAGASYWGIPGLSGNVWERTITVGNSAGRSFSGLHGDGALDASGLFDVTNWNINGLGFRGGSFTNSISNGYLRISDRNSALHTSDNRNAAWGGRGARTAP